MYGYLCLGRRWSLGVLHRGRRVPDGLLDVGVARAPAQVAADDLVDLLLGDLRGPVAVLEPGLDRHEEARRAEPALQRVALAERLLHRVQLLPAPPVVAGQPLDGLHLVALRLDG